jgi:glucose-1-phosphate cytidylyltransferase
MNDFAKSLEDITVVALCGGKGERLRPFTDTVPKPLVELHGRPLLEHLLSFLSASGLRKFAICTGYKAEAIHEFVARKGAAFGELHCVDSGESAAMCDRVLDARKRIRGRALVCYGDTLANVSVPALVAAHEASGAKATVAVYPLTSPFGIVAFDERHRVTQLQEKPVLPYWINIGFLLLEPEALDRLRRGTDLVSYMDQLATDSSLGVFLHSGQHLTVNTEKERADAEKEIEFFTLMEGKTS